MRNLNTLGESTQICLVPTQAVKFSGFRPELLCHTKQAVWDCIVDYIGHNGLNPARKETWLLFANEDGLWKYAEPEETPSKRLSDSHE